MKITNDSFVSSDGKTLVSYLQVQPDDGQPVKGIVQIVHGMCEYIDRYRDFMEYLAQAGYIVVGHDHLGHGKTAGSEENLGYFAPKDGYKYLIADVTLLAEMIRKEHPGLPYFLMGHSMGSFVARLATLEMKDFLAGAVYSGTGAGNPAGPVGIGIVDQVIRKKGVRYRPQMVTQMAFGTYNSHFRPQRTDKDWLSRDTEMVDRYCQDPYCNFTFTASAYRDLFLLNRLSNTKEWFQRYPKQLPVYFFSGDQDPVGSYGKGVEKVVKQLRQAGVREVSLRLYHEGRHEMLNETNRAEVYQNLLDWLEQHIPAPASGT